MDFREDSKLVEINWYIFVDFSVIWLKKFNWQPVDQFNQPHVKPGVKYGILIYGTTSRATMQKIDAKVRRILRVNVSSEGLTQCLSSERKTKFFQLWNFTYTKFLTDG